MRRIADIDHRVGFLVAIVGLLVLAGCATDGGETSQIGDVSEAVSSYEDLGTAEEEGYVQFSVPVPGMGVHYLHESAIGDDATSTLDRSLDRNDPEILVYAKEKGSSERQLAAVEYAIPVEEGEKAPPQEAVELFDDADAKAWHPHPSRHELKLDADWTVHAECHYEGGPGVWLAENPNGSFVQMTPKGQVGNWSGDVAPDQCPEQAGGEDLPPLLLVHEKWWTLHAWVGIDNPEGTFHPTNPNVSP